MPTYLPIKAVRTMTYAELERWWEVDFDAFTTTAVAEATGEVHSSVAEALRSDDWIEQWSDALFCAVAELSSSVEWMEYKDDPRLRRTRQRFGHVQHRMQQVNTLLRHRAREQGRSMAPAAHKDGTAMACGILAKHHFEEFSRLRLEELERRGLSKDKPLWSESYPDGLACVEDFVMRGIIEAPITDELRQLFAAPPGTLKARTAADVARQDERDDLLRHPLVLRAWGMCLKEVMIDSAKLSEIEPNFAATLPRLDMKALHAMPASEASKHLNRRRFLRGLVQRKREYDMHHRQLVRVASQRREQLESPWIEASDAARQEVARRHPEEYEALMAALRPYLKADSMAFDAEVSNVKDRARLGRALREQLVDGTLLVPRQRTRMA